MFPPADSAEIKKNNDEIEEEIDYKISYKWRNIIVFIYLHVFSVCSAFYPPQQISTFVIQITMGVLIGFGTTAGSHRYFTHRSYRASKSLRFIMIVLQTMSGQEPIYRWVRDHRVHHKFTDTNADPHNAARGFFFSHMGWLCCKKHPDVLKHGKKIDMSDLEGDRMIQIQRR